MTSRLMGPGMAVLDHLGLDLLQQSIIMLLAQDRVEQNWLMGMPEGTMP